MYGEPFVPESVKRLKSIRMKISPPPPRMGRQGLHEEPFVPESAQRLNSIGMDLSGSELIYEREAGMRRELKERAKSIECPSCHEVGNFKEFILDQGLAVCNCRAVVYVRKMD